MFECLLVQELGKSRGRTNHSVAGIHYYHSEYVPKSTHRSASFSLTLFVLQVKVVEHFFFFFLFFKAGETWAYFMVPSQSEQSTEKKWRNLWDAVIFEPGFISLRSTFSVEIHSSTWIVLSSTTPNQTYFGWVTIKFGNFTSQLLTHLSDCSWRKIPPGAVQIPVNGCLLITPDSADQSRNAFPAEISTISVSHLVRACAQTAGQREWPLPNGAWQSKSRNKRNVSLMWK